MQKLLAGTIGAFLTLLAATGTGAEPLTHARPADRAPNPWAAVGRLDFAGTSWCTGTLIAEDLVLTAAHCLYDRDTGRRYDASRIAFRAGLRGGSAAAVRGVTRAVTDGGFAYRGDDKVTRVAHDLALLRLDAPIRDAAIRPLPTDVRPRKGAELGVVSYAETHPEDPALQPLCAVLARQGGLLVLGCASAPGASGAPVFEIADGRPRVVSVISAMATLGPREVSLGTALTYPLAGLMEAMAATAPDAPASAPLALVEALVEARLDAGDGAIPFLVTGN